MVMAQSGHPSRQKTNSHPNNCSSFSSAFRQRYLIINYSILNFLYVYQAHVLCRSLITILLTTYVNSAGSSNSCIQNFLITLDAQDDLQPISEVSSINPAQFICSNFFPIISTYRWLQFSNSVRTFPSYTNDIPAVQEQYQGQPRRISVCLVRPKIHPGTRK